MSPKDGNVDQIELVTDAKIIAAGPATTHAGGATKPVQPIEVKDKPEKKPDGKEEAKTEAKDAKPEAK